MNPLGIFKEHKPKKKFPNEIAFIYSEEYNIDLMDHVFPGNKFRKIFEILNLDEEFSRVNFFEPTKASKEDLLLVHDSDYIEDLFNLRLTERTKYSELPLDEKILNGFLLSVGGTILATELVKEFKFVYNIGGGFHHSFSSHAEGFCYLNDVAVSSEIYLKKNPNAKILIIDLDVHQGNGNAFYFKNHKNVYTFSIHEENIYPKKQISNLDIGLKPNTKTNEYLKILESSIGKIETEFKPDLIFYLAGADVFENDLLGSIKMNMKGIIKRDEIVKSYVEKIGAKAIILTAGGYSKNFIETVQIHLNTAKVFLREL